MPISNVRILFLISGPIAGVRHVPFIRALATRGHSVVVAYDAGGQGLNVLKALAAELPLVQLRRSPTRLRSDTWQAFLTRLRQFQDFLLYFEDRYGGKAGTRLRWRVEQHLTPRAATFVKHVYLFTGRPGIRALRALMRGLDLAIAPPPEYARFLQQTQPDVVLLGSLTDYASMHVDYVKAASALGTPAAMIVGQGSELTHHGAVNMLPRRGIVATDEQKSHLGTLHRMAASKVDVIGGAVIDGQPVLDPGRVTAVAETLAAGRVRRRIGAFRVPLRPVLWLAARWTHSLELAELEPAEAVKPARRQKAPETPQKPALTMPVTVARTPAVDKPRIESPRVDGPPVAQQKVDVKVEQPTPALKADTPKVVQKLKALQPLRLLENLNPLGKLKLQETLKAEQPRIELPPVNLPLVNAPQVEPPLVAKVEVAKVEVAKVEVAKVKAEKVKVEKVKVERVRVAEVRIAKVARVKAAEVTAAKLEAARVEAEAAKLEAAKVKAAKAEAAKAAAAKVKAAERHAKRSKKVSARRAERMAERTAKAADRADRAARIRAKRRRARLRAIVQELDHGNERLRKQLRRASHGLARRRETAQRSLRLAQDRTHKRLKRARRAARKLGDRVRQGVGVVWRRLRDLGSPKQARRIGRRIRALPFGVKTRVKSPLVTRGITVLHVPSPPAGAGEPARPAELPVVPPVSRLDTTDPADLQRMH